MFEFFLLRWTDKRSRLFSKQVEPGIEWYSGTSGAPCEAENAKQWKTRKGADKARKQYLPLPLEVVRFVARIEH